MNGKTLCALCFAIYVTAVSASVVGDLYATELDALDVHGRLLLEDADFEAAKASDRAAWAATTHGGGKRKRALLQANYGKANGKFPLLPSTTSVSSPDKVQPTGYDCIIASSATASQDCTGFSAYVVPGCCSSSSETTSTKCATLDSGENILCSAAARPYPACCTFRNQTTDVCDSYSGTGITCSGLLPGRACCYSDGNCRLQAGGGGSSCPSTSDLGCCPA